jgi:hypothetical protein
MFKKIEKIDSLVADQTHFPKAGEKIIGLPIRFVLMPIKQFIDVNVEKLYFKLSDSVLKSFNEYLVKVQDIRTQGYIKKRVINSCKSLTRIILDDRSHLSKEIHNYEKELKLIGEEYFQKSVSELKKYKIGKSNIENILQLITSFESVCSSNTVFEKVSEFIEQGESV